VAPLPAMIIGILAGIVCYFFVAVVKAKFGYDDSLDVFGVHGVGGALGTLAVGIFASKLVNPGGADGLLFGHPGLFVAQVVGVVAVTIFSGVVTFILYKIVDALVGLRVSETDEITGLDLSQHRESAYND